MRLHTNSSMRKAIAAYRMQQCHNDMHLLMLARQQQVQRGTGQVVNAAAASQPQEAASLTEQLMKDFRVMPMQVGCCLPSALHLSSAAQGCEHSCVIAECTDAGTSMCALVLCVPGSCCLCLPAARSKCQGVHDCCCAMARV